MDARSFAEPGAAPPAPLTLDEAEAAKIVWRVVYEKAYLFQHFSEYDVEDDLFPIAMQAVREWFRQWADNPRVAFSTFVYRRARNTLVDLWRKRQREENRTHKWAETLPGFFLDEQVDDTPAGDLAAWASSMMGRIQRGLAAGGVGVGAARGRGGQPTVSEAQRLTLILLVRRQKLSTRGAELLVGGRRELREALGLARPLSRNFFQRLPKSDSRIRQHLRRMGMTTDKGGERGRRGQVEADMAKLSSEWDMTPEDVAEYLGVAPSTLATWREQRRNLAFFRLGREIRYRSSDVRQFHDRQVVQPVAAKG